MADDLRRHLASEPISARRITRLERALKFARRNRLALASAIDYTADPLWKALGRLEWRRIWDGNTTLIDEQQDSVLAIVTVA